MKKTLILLTSGLMLLGSAKASEVVADRNEKSLTIVTDLRKDDKEKILKQKNKELKKRQKALKEREKEFEKERSLMEKERKLNKRERRLLKKEAKLHN